VREGIKNMFWWYLGWVFSILLALDAAFHKKAGVLVFFILVDVLGCIFMGYNEAQFTGACVVGIIDTILLLVVLFQPSDRAY
jgi:hypothetical protein